MEVAVRLTPQIVVAPTRKSAQGVGVMAKTDYQTLLWSQMANEARSVADRLVVDGLKQSVLAVAERYDALAKRAEMLARRRKVDPL
jgi:hypothetical protein